MDYNFFTLLILTIRIFFGKSRYSFHLHKITFSLKRIEDGKSNKLHAN